MGRENIEWTHWVPDFNMIRENGVGRESRERTNWVPDFNIIRENGVGRESRERTRWVPHFSMIRENGVGRESREQTHWVPDFNMIRENGVGRESREQTRLVPDFNMIRENGVGRENGEQTHWVPDSNMIRENGVGRENGERTHWVPAFFMGRGNWKWTRCIPAEPEASKRFENAFPKRQNTKKTWKQPKIKSHDQIEFDHELLIKKLLALQIATYEENCWKLFEQKGSPTADNDGAQCAEKGMLGYDDIPWPHEEGCDLRDVEDFLFGDREKGSMEYKTYLRQQQVRWHPDRFLSRCGDRLIDSHKQRIIGKVMELSQLLNRLIQEMQK